MALQRGARGRVADSEHSQSCDPRRSQDTRQDVADEGSMGRKRDKRPARPQKIALSSYLVSTDARAARAK